MGETRPPSIDPDALALAARAGSVDAFEQLVARYESPLFNFLRVRSARREDAEELTQEAFLRAWQRIERYDPRWPFATWLFTIAGRLSVSHRRKRGSRVPHGGESALDRDALDTGDPADEASLREERDNLWALARRVLGVEQRSALWLRYAEGLSHAEVARVLGRRETTVRVLVFRARERLRPHLAEDEAVPARYTAPGWAGGRP